MLAIRACSRFFSIIFSLSLFAIIHAGVLERPIAVAVNPPIDGQSHLLLRLESFLKREESTIESVFFSAAIRGRVSFGGTYNLTNTWFTGGLPSRSSLSVGSNLRMVMMTSMMTLASSTADIAASWRRGRRFL